MTTLIRFAVSFACAAGAACSLASGQVAQSTERKSLANDLAAFLATQPKWSASTTVRAGYGYKDNLLLSSADEERSAFARGSVEFLLLRVPGENFDCSFYAEAERTFFLSSVATENGTFDHEAKVWVQAEPAYRFGDNVKFALPLTGYYYDQVYDVSEVEIERRIADIRVRGAMVGPSARWDFLPSWWIQAQGVGQWKRYDDGVNDGRVREGNFRLGWTGADWLEIRVCGAQRWRDYSHRLQYSSSGRELSDTPLKMTEREAELEFDFKLDRAGHWRTVTRAGWLDCRDNGSGWFNYHEPKIGHEIEWKTEPWFLRVGGSAGRLDFPVWKVGFGVTPATRVKEEFMAELHIERKLSSRWATFAEYTWERSRSNDAIASYTVNEGLLGVRWNWEK